jgi:hypothetical protein
MQPQVYMPVINNATEYFLSHFITKGVNVKVERQVIPIKLIYKKNFCLNEHYTKVKTTSNLYN